ncbi:MAG: Cobyric acid synthase [Candidatus Heimdallarchaeota archaeon LC_3]|nr:MAG: Cobyric acid synthase [Candidatus Heimdallarchaeota archaeon LC_3]
MDENNQFRVEGAIKSQGTIWGTYIHGLFENFELKKDFLDYFRRKNNLKNGKTYNYSDIKNKGYNLLAEIVNENLDIKKIYEIIGNGVSLKD